MIKYTEQSIKVEKDGYYLVRVDTGNIVELEIAEASVMSRGEVAWYQTACDFDAWNSDRDEYTLTVICGFDLQAIADSHARIDMDPTETGK